MVAGLFDGPELIVVLVVVLVLFGGSQLPKLARNIGQAQKEFKKGIEDGSTDPSTGSPTAPPKDQASTPE
jgi:sec-independent protein translocase protein TatA